MISDGNGKPESRQSDPGQVMKLLEIELAQKKVEWAAASERYRAIRTAAFCFLALVIMGALVGFFFIFTRVSGERPVAPTPTASPTPSR